MQYLDLLAMLHHLLAPQAYLEIGVWRGDSLALAAGPAVGIDPAPQIACDIVGAKPWLKLYQTTSDEFFAHHEAARVLEGAALELAFIDGMHLFEHALRDFRNVERWSSRFGAVAIHDVIPPDPAWATRERRSQAWTGDVWRIVPCLRDHRPDLRLHVIDAFPSGMLLVTGLDPANPVLFEREDEIVARYLEDPRPYDRQVADHLNAIDRVPLETWYREARRTLGA